jgi:hypothetical protein
MKMYTVQFFGNYGLGMVVVAADTPSQAKAIATTAEQWFKDYGDTSEPRVIRGATIDRKQPCVLDSFWYQE